MANWLMVMDGDDARRGEYVEALSGRISPVEGLVAGSCGGRGWCAQWAAGPGAPVEWRSQEGGGALVFGEPRGNGGALQGARDVFESWRDGAVSQWDGYYAALVVKEESGSLTVGTDLLGIFPVYYCSPAAGVVLVGTSPELFGTHGLFRAQLNEAGLVGILLTNGLVGGQTLWRGVRRLGAGRRLRVERGRVWEDVGYELPTPRQMEDLPLAGHAAQLAQVVGDAVKRHTESGRRYGMLLSGGLDSRMIAGFLHRANIRPNTLTIGIGGDLEMRCARAVARVYGLSHVTAEPQARDIPAFAQIQARCEHLANGFNTVRDWWTQSQLQSLGDRVVTGGLADSLVGATSIGWAFGQNPPRMTYELFRRQMPKLGIDAGLLRRLLRTPDLLDAIDDVELRLRTEFHECSTQISRCAWRYDLAHGQRFHVGATIWRLSFGAWPVVPMLDRRVAEVAAAIPATSMAGREAQLALVGSALPELADVPLDRSDIASDVPQYLNASFRHLLENSLRLHARRLLKPLRSRGLGREPRYWYRINDFGGTAWMNARRAIEQQRAAWHGRMDAELLQELLPPPDATPRKAGPWIGESGRKLLLGLLYWSGSHPGSVA